MNGSQLMGLDSVGIGIYAIHGYFCKLTVGQRTPRFLGCHTPSMQSLMLVSRCGIKPLYLLR